MAQPIIRKVLLAVGLALAAEAAQGQALIVRLYPLTGDEKSAAAVADAQPLLEAAVATAARRSERLVPATPLVMKPSCGRVPGADCLAPLAGEGVVIWGTARPSATDVVVTLHAVDARARVHGPVRARIDGYLQSAEPIVTALLELETLVPAAPSAETGTSKALARSAPPPAAKGPGAPLRYKDPAPPPRPDWKRTFGKWASGGGLVLLAGGAAVAALNQRLATDLEERFSRNQLTAADAAKYDRVDDYNLLSNALLAAGGVATATGLVVWGMAPDVRPTRGGATFGVQGSF